MEILVIFFLTLLNGFFALSEIALVSVKKSKMEHLAEQGSKNAKKVLRLLKNPENFLSSVQVGITLIGIVSGAYGGATLTDDMAVFLSTFNFFGEYLDIASLIIVIGAITYFTIVIGELVPKNIALNNPEAIALNIVPIIKIFTIVTYPFVKLLSGSTKIILKIIRVKEEQGDKISEDELLFMLKAARKQGVLEKEETQAHYNLFSFTDQTAKSLLTHSSDVEWINMEDSKEDIFNKLKESVHSKFIVSKNSIDNIEGIITSKDFFEIYHKKEFDFKEIIKKPIVVSSHTPAFKIINLFRKYKQYIGIVVDEYGGVIGIVTLHDLFEAIIGDLPDEDELDEFNIIKREDGSYLIDGKTKIFEINQYFNIQVLEDNQTNYSTIAGFIMYNLKNMPKTADTITVNNYKLEIVDMDGMRIDKVLMSMMEREE